MSAAPIKLSFGDVLSESFRYFFGNLRLFFHLVTIPWIISILLRVAGAAIDEDSLVVVLAEKALDAIPTAMFMIAWMRGVLLGPHATGPLPGLSWSPRETAFFVHLLKVAGIPFLLLAGFVIATGGGVGFVMVGPQTIAADPLAVPFGTAFMISAFLALRVSFGLAASAVDMPFAPRQSWTYSRGNGWKIVSVLFLIFFMSALATMVAAMVPFAIVRGIGAGQAAAVVAWTVAILVTYVGTGVAATAQAIIFRTLTGWRP